MVVKIKVQEIRNQLVRIKHNKSQEDKSLIIDVIKEQSDLEINDNWKFKEVVKDEFVFIRYKWKNDFGQEQESMELWRIMMIRGWFWNYLVIHQDEDGNEIISTKPTIGYAGISRNGYMWMVVMALLSPLLIWQVWKNRKKTNSWK